MQTVSVFQFEKIGSFVRAYYEMRKRHEHTYSYNRLAKAMGFRALSTVAMVATEVRKPTPEFVCRLAGAVGFSEKERMYAETLLSLERSRTTDEKKRCLARLKILAPNNSAMALDLDKFKLVSRWIHFAILEMVNLKDFSSNSKWIAGKLRFKTSEREIQNAIARLVRVGTLTWTTSGKLVRNAEHVATTNDVPNTAIRTFHRDMLHNALEAIDSQEVDERVITGVTLTTDASREKEAREFIHKCIQDYIRNFEVVGGDRTVHFSIQNFRLTEVLEQ